MRQALRRLATQAPAGVALCDDPSERQAATWLREYPAQTCARVAGRVGTKRLQLEQQLVTWRVADWRADPLARGGYAWVRAGGMSAVEELRKPVAETLFFAGEAVHAGGFAGTVHGALETGELAARAIIGSERRAR